MHKLLQLQSALLKEIDKYEKLVSERDQPIDWERVHISSCAKLGYLMAEERGVDPVLAASACAIHDYGRIITGKQENHAEAGYLPVQDFLKKTGLFTEEEMKTLSIAVKNHSKKSEVGGPIEEIVKDADVLDFYQYGYIMPRQEQQARLEKLLKKK
ncbi:HD domain-containing protein [Aminipila terrae]|uniref:HD domain-containing protein n=1 Tax=Aminipila terrae TaxID=2697030 RepID=A0A6P1MEF7_9FIRM|nr:HD domain-containing protein [Aminipila terrae]QHI72287.1 HD domain-containing protein [Aminipila terrae]